MGLPRAYHALALSHIRQLFSLVCRLGILQTVTFLCHRNHQGGSLFLFSQGSVPAWTATEQTYRHVSEWPAGFGKTACSDFSCCLQKQKNLQLLAQLGQLEPRQCA